MSPPIDSAGRLRQAQQLLLKAALLEGDAALAAWSALQSGDLDPVIGESYALLPRLYHNLRRLSVDHPVMGRLKGVYLHSWSRNQFLVRSVAPVIDALCGGGFEPLVCGATAVSLLHSQDPGLRPLGAFDLLMRPRFVRPALDVLSTLGWRDPRLKAPLEDVVAFRDALLLESGSGQRLQLWWRLPGESSQGAGAEGGWPGGGEVDLLGVPARTLDATELLLHICAGSAGLEPATPLAWVADAMSVLTSPHALLDWDRLVFIARRGCLTLHVGDALAYLAQEFSAPVPHATLRALRAVAPSRLERAEQRFQVGGGTGVLGRMPSLVFRYWRLQSGRSLAKQTGDLPCYLKAMWNAGTGSQVLVQALAKSARGAGRAIRRATGRVRAGR